MIYKYIVTSEVKSRLAKENLGKDVKDRLDNFLSCDNQMNATSLKENLLVSKFHSGFRFVWFQEIRRDVCLYILRRIYRHVEYNNNLNEVTRLSWMNRHALSPDEQGEVDTEFAKYFKEAKKDNLPDEYCKYEDSRAPHDPVSENPEDPTTASGARKEIKNLINYKKLEYLCDSLKLDEKGTKQFKDLWKALKDGLVITISENGRASGKKEELGYITKAVESHYEIELSHYKKRNKGIRELLRTLFCKTDKANYADYTKGDLDTAVCLATRLVKSYKSGKQKSKSIIALDEILKKEGFPIPEE